MSDKIREFPKILTYANNNKMRDKMEAAIEAWAVRLVLAGAEAFSWNTSETSPFKENPIETATNLPVVKEVNNILMDLFDKIIDGE
ncbi:MAG: hypothetical protein FWG29_05615 [Treponema sp.]|nr:hypothetical protein [Treponema sp.]